MPKNFGQTLKRLREEKGLSLRKLASQIKVTPAFLSDVEHNRRATNKLVELARVLDVDVSVLEDADRRLTPKLREWVSENPEVVKLLATNPAVAKWLQENPNVIDLIEVLVEEGLSSSDAVKAVRAVSQKRGSY
jgi:transcriptional regulator with XRE-family HTH domain